MNEYLLLIHGNEKSATSADEWERFFDAAWTSGVFRGGSEVGKREFVGDQVSARSSAHIVGYMRFESDDKQVILSLLELHPVVLHGGTVELCELPKS
jgi:hypothetical protein